MVRVWYVTSWKSAMSSTSSGWVGGRPWAGQVSVGTGHPRVHMTRGDRQHRCYHGRGLIAAKLRWRGREFRQPMGGPRAPPPEVITVITILTLSLYQQLRLLSAPVVFGLRSSGRRYRELPATLYTETMHTHHGTTYTSRIQHPWKY